MVGGMTTLEEFMERVEEAGVIMKLAGRSEAEGDEFIHAYFCFEEKYKCRPDEFLEKAARAFPTVYKGVPEALPPMMVGKINCDKGDRFTNGWNACRAEFIKIMEESINE